MLLLAVDADAMLLLAVDADAILPLTVDADAMLLLDVDADAMLLPICPWPSPSLMAVESEASRGADDSPRSTAA
jgi:hypothetical protein